MNTKFSKNFLSEPTPSTSTEDSFINLNTLSSLDDSIITLIPCEYDPINGYDSLSEDSIDSSEILDSSDDELEIIKINELYKINKQTI